MDFPFKMYGLWNEQRQSGGEKKTFNHREWKLLFSISVSNCNFSADFSLYSTWMADCTELRVSIAEHVSWSMGGFICTFSLLISLSITLRTSKFRNQFTISSKYFDMACYLKRETYSGPISFEVQGNDICNDSIQSFEMSF